MHEWTRRIARGGIISAASLFFLFPIPTALLEFYAFHNTTMLLFALLCQLFSIISCVQLILIAKLSSKHRINILLIPTFFIYAFAITQLLCEMKGTPNLYWIYQYILYNSVVSLYSIGIAIFFTLVEYAESSNLTVYRRISKVLFYGTYTILLICFLAIPPNRNTEELGMRLINFLFCTLFSMVSQLFLKLVHIRQNESSNSPSYTLIGISIVYIVLYLPLGIYWTAESFSEIMKYTSDKFTMLAKFYIFLMFGWTLTCGVGMALLLNVSRTKPYRYLKTRLWDKIWKESQPDELLLDSAPNIVNLNIDDEDPFAGFEYLPPPLFDNSGILDMVDEIGMGEDNIPASQVAARLIKIEFEQIKDHTCAICWDELTKEADIVAVSGCKHAFHRECIFTWINKDTRCPVCRGNII